MHTVRRTSRLRFTGVKYATSIAQGFFVANRRTDIARFADTPNRTRACRSDSSTLRSDVGDDHGPSP
jgi:hypothetical protein